MARTIVLNRPWISSFSFTHAPYSASRMEQVHKLSRNFIASLDLGCPNAKHVKRTGCTREDYKVWVQDWKTIYQQVTTLTRLLKKWRKTVKFPKLTPEQLKLVEWNRAKDDTRTPQQILNRLSYDHLPRLRETAQALLNARYNAKLAAAERRRRALEQLPQVKQAA